MSETQNTPEEVDPEFIPEDSPRFDPPPIEPAMDASGPTDRDAPDLGPPPPNDQPLEKPNADSQ